MRTRIERTMLAVALGIVTALGFVGAAGAEEPAHAKADKEFTVAAVQYEGTKLWLPATLVVNKGDHVKVHLINKIPTDPAQHGWAVDAFKIAAVVNRGENPSVEFVADKAGIFPIYCQLHPAHVGGELVVLDRK
jgi:plastocyanin